MEIYQDASRTPEERAKDLLAKMSLDEKMGQVNCIFPFSFFLEVADADIRKHHGAGEVSALDIKSRPDVYGMADWQREMQEKVLAASEHGIPAIFHMEGLTGAMIPEAVSFPSGIARGSSWDPALEHKIGQITARQELAIGMTHTLAPVLDVSRDSRMGRQGESYGEDPALISAMGSAYAGGVQETEVDGRRTEAVAKHFCGFHAGCAGIHGAHTELGPRVVREIYAKPFQAAIRESNMRGIMPCYCTNDGIPVSADREYLTHILREEMGFDGVCVSDYSAVSQVHEIKGVGETPAEAGYLCMQAGMDCEMPMSVGYNQELKEMFADGRADMAVLDQAVLRMLTAKFRMGLFEHPFALRGEALDKALCGEEDEAVCLASAREGIVLLKNDGVLPLPKEKKKILLVGPQMKNPRFYYGGYTTISMEESQHVARDSTAGVKDDRTLEGFDTEAEAKIRALFEKQNENPVTYLPGTKVQDDNTEVFQEVLRRLKPRARDIFSVLAEKLPLAELSWAGGYPVAGADDSKYAEALALAKEADVILLALGGKYGTGSIATMGEGIDATNINLPPCQENFIREAAKLGKPMVGVHIDGRPISSDAADACLQAIVEAWTLSDMAAEAIAEVLTGEYNPCGKLTVSVARNAGQIPIYYNLPGGSAWSQAESIGFTDYVDCPHTPRYRFGHGLSYTKFAYGDLTVDKKEVLPGETVRIGCTVENTGACDGTEIVQLYIRDRYASVSRPIQELAGFARVELGAGEKREVTFAFRTSQLAFLDPEMRWKIEAGEIEVQIGSSSADIRLRDSFRITENAWIEGRERAFCCVGEVK